MERVTEKVIRIAKGLLEAGTVQRWHCTPHHQSYSVGRHSWGMAALLYVLHPDPCKSLIWAVLFHDVPERWLGDTPGPARWTISTQLGDVIREAEKRINAHYEIDIHLGEEEQRWLKGLDLLELYVYVCNEVHMGNGHMRRIMIRLHDMISGSDQLPSEIKEFARRYTSDRTSDVLGDSD